MDNRIFNVNGRSKETLRAVLELAFEQEGANTAARGYIIDPKKGMVLLWSTTESGTPFLAPLKATAATEMVWEWLQSKPEIECEDWDKDLDHDGHNVLGWRAFVEDWGHVAVGPNYSGSGGSHYAIVAVKPAYIWMGK